MSNIIIKADKKIDKISITINPREYKEFFVSQFNKKLLTQTIFIKTGNKGK